MGEAVFLLLSQRHKLDKLEKSSLLQLLPHFSLSTMHEVVDEAIFFAKHFLQNSSASYRKSLMKLFSKKTALLVKLSCAKQALSLSRDHCARVERHAYFVFLVFLIHQQYR